MHLTPHFYFPPRSRSAGFALIEVLVTVVVVAIGLLGVAGMQATALRYGHSAYMRSLATLQATDIADRMRANIPAVASGRYQMGLNTAATPMAKSACFSASGCVSDDMAANDLYEWTTEVNARLPGSTAVVCTDSSPDDGSASSPACDNVGSTYAVKIWWNDDRTGQQQRFVKSFNL